jgi:hypothetical protein
LRSRIISCIDREIHIDGFKVAMCAKVIIVWQMDIPSSITSKICSNCLRPC